jgi:predicted nuclease of predicted toxin-antitoxin system
MKVLVDMKLSPDWVPVLQAAGFEALHWSKVGKLPHQAAVTA